MATETPAGSLRAEGRRLLLDRAESGRCASPFDQRTGEPVVTFRFDAAGATLRQDHPGECRSALRCLLDNKVITAPRINEPILGGTGQISGNFTAEQANDLAVLLRSGALPAKLTLIEERTVGASLGADSDRSGKKAAPDGARARRDLHVHGL